MKYIKKRINSVYKSHGGKTYLTKKIISVMEYRPTYVDLFFGGGSIFLNIDEKFQMVYLNDINTGIIDIFRSIQRDGDEFYRRLKLIDVHTEHNAKYLFNLYKNYGGFPESNLFVNRFSRSANNKTFGWSDRLRGGKPEYINAWENSLNLIHPISNIISGAKLTNFDFVSFLEQNPLKDSVIYCDPPYLHETRISPNSYKFEMNNDQHICLLNLLLDLVNKHNCIIYLSGYQSNLYSYMIGPPTYVFEVDCPSSQLKSKPRREECLWEIK